MTDPRTDDDAFYAHLFGAAPSQTSPAEDAAYDAIFNPSRYTDAEALTDALYDTEYAPQFAPLNTHRKE